MSYSWNIALRYLKGKHKRSPISLNTFISIGGVAVGVMTLIVVLSVMSGFENDLKKKILGTNSPIIVMSYDEKAVYAQDYELWSRLLAYGRAFNIREPLVRYRTHRRQISQRSLPEQNESRDRISRMNLERRGIPCVSDEDLMTLRKWVVRGPHLSDMHDMQLGRMLLRMIDTFSRCGDVDPVAARQLRRTWVRRLLEATPGSQAIALATSPPTDARRWVSSALFSSKES